jgi:predicted RNase H-like HicB family nuclease
MKIKNHHDHEEIITAASGDFTCLFRRDIDGGYRVTCAKLPPMLAVGATLEEARDNARDEIEVWIYEHERARDWPIERGQWWGSDPA